MKLFITGASSGIGAALARHYARLHAGDLIIGIAGRHAERLTTLGGELGRACVQTYIHDVTDRIALRKAADDFLHRFGTPDLVIANAGISTGTDGGRDGDMEVLSRVLETNVTGLAATLQPFVVPMRTAGRGRLVGIASVAGFRGLPGSGAYSASKAAAIAWLEALRVELHGSGVRVVTICPGYIDTPMTRVNNYIMPFLMSAEEGAKRIARAIDSGRSLVIVPWQMRLVFSVLRLLPPWMHDAIFSRVPRKPLI